MNYTKITSQVTLTLLCLTSPLMEINKSWAKEINRNELSPKNSTIVNTNEINKIQIYIEQIKNPNPNLNQPPNVPFDALVKIGKPAIPSLIQLLGDKNSSIRQNAAQTLGRIGKDAVSPLLETVKIEAVKSKNSFTRPAAIMALGFIGKDAKIAVPTLIKFLQDNDITVRERAIIALGQIKSESKLVVPLLIKALEDKNETIRRSAALALGNIGEDSAPAVPALIYKLEDKSFFVANSAIVALSEIGKPATPAIPSLIKIFNREINTFSDPALDTSIRINATTALGNIGIFSSETVIPVLIKGLEDKDVFLRNQVVASLGNFKSQPSLIVPALTKILDDRDESIQATAAVSLSKMGIEAAIAVPKLAAILTTALENRNYILALSSVSALGNMGEKGKQAIPQLKVALQSDYRLLRLETASALISIGEESSKLLPILKSELQNRDRTIGLYAAYGLIKAKVESKIGYSIILKDLKDPNQKNWSTAIFYINEISNYLDTQAKYLSPTQRQEGITFLEEVLKISNGDNKLLSQEVYLKSVRSTLNILRTYRNG